MEEIFLRIPFVLAVMTAILNREAQPLVATAQIISFALALSCVVQPTE